MAGWPAKPQWNSLSTINAGVQYLPVDGVTADDMNKIIENMTYLKKYGSKINVLKIDATVVGTRLKVRSEDA